MHWLGRIAQRDPTLFVLWQLGVKPEAESRSRMRRELHVRFCEGGGVHPSATRLVVGFEHREEAERFLAALRERFARFGLALHPGKTRLIEFGRYADRTRRTRGDGKPATFNFLGFTHLCAKTRQGRFTVRRQTMRQRWQAKLREVKTRCDSVCTIPCRRSAPICARSSGGMRYYGVPLNTAALRAFAGRSDVCGIALRRRSQRTRVTGPRGPSHRSVASARGGMSSAPLVRFGVLTQGKSRMR